MRPEARRLPVVAPRAERGLVAAAFVAGVCDGAQDALEAFRARAARALERLGDALGEFRALQREMQATEEWKRTKRWKHVEARTAGVFRPPEPETPTWKLEDSIDSLLTDDDITGSLAYVRRQLSRKGQVVRRVPLGAIAARTSR